MNEENKISQENEELQENKEVVEVEEKGETPKEKQLRERQEDFIDKMTSIRKKKKITQKKLDMTQKVISNIENHVSDPKLSSIIAYLDSIGYDINNLFRGNNEWKKPTIPMVKHLNLLLATEGSKLRYVHTSTDILLSYELTYDDEYIDKRYKTNIIVTEEFEEKVRNFFREYGIEDIGYSNTVTTLFVENPEFKWRF